MALIPNPRPDKYGGVSVRDQRWVSGFTRAGSGEPSYHFIGVQVVAARVFEAVEDGVPAETVNGIYPRLIAVDRQSVGAFICEASFRDIGTPADYLDTSIHLADVGRRSADKRARVDIDPTASHRAHRTMG